jgi:hypothetical protein
MTRNSTTGDSLNGAGRALQAAGVLLWAAIKEGLLEGDATAARAKAARLGGTLGADG